MCGHTCAKITLIVFNIIFWLAGGALLGVSIWALVDEDSTYLLNVLPLANSDQLLRVAAITLCVVGGLIFVMGFIGCCGAMKESACLLNTYATVVIILLLGQVVAGVLAIVFKDRILRELNDGMMETVTQRYGMPGYDTQTDAVDFLQTQFECCGVKRPFDDWQSSAWNLTSPLNVPASCCVVENKKVGVPRNLTACQAEATIVNGTNSVFFHNTGCYDSMYNWVRSHSVILMGVAFGLAGLQIILAILACCAKNQKKNSYQEV